MLGIGATLLAITVFSSGSGSDCASAADDCARQESASNSGAVVSESTPEASATAVEPSATPSPEAAAAVAAPTPQPSAQHNDAPAPMDPASHDAPAAAPAASGGPCGAACGDPRYFCDTWGGGFCDDFREKTSGAAHVPFPAPGDPYSFDAFSTSYPHYDTEGPAPADGMRAFSANEHFMTVIEDGQFGLGVLRVQQPFDFAGRTGHLHFDVDLKTGARRYVRFMLSPELTKVLTDDRHQADRRPGNAFDLWFVNGTFDAQVSKGGTLIWEQQPGRYYGADNVRDHVDVYISRTHVRVTVNGTPYVDADIPDLGFDRAYMYLAQASYNPCKDGECDPDLQMFHWDNIAFDGPALPRNSLTPAGSRDVLFNAYRADSCSVRGVPAEPVGPEYQWSRVTWRVRLPDDGTPIGAGDVSCNNNFVQDGSDVPGGLEVVRQ